MICSIFKIKMKFKPKRTPKNVVLKWLDNFFFDVVVSTSMAPAIERIYSSSPNSQLSFLWGCQKVSFNFPHGEVGSFMNQNKIGLITSRGKNCDFSWGKGTVHHSQRWMAKSIWYLEMIKVHNIISKREKISWHQQKKFVRNMQWLIWLWCCFWFLFFFNK